MSLGMLQKMAQDHQDKRSNVVLLKVWILLKIEIT